MDASDIDAAGQTCLARDAVSWMHLAETHLAGYVYADASKDAFFDSAMSASFL